MTLTAVPRETRTRPRRVVPPVVTITGLAAASLALYLRDPHASGSWGYCPISLLGFYCPGCGGLRAVNDLTHGDLAGALSSNALLILAMPFAVFLLARWAIDAWRGRQRGLPELSSWPVLSVVIALITVFTLARNLPGSWLAP
ncbi:MAG TPA: DUF2752 domain-containing protein [Nocardioides sp.]|jgi:hypothetical protein|nr:DUF2752 domain-containing protein [Nocardioides sp.]